jgi:hypothetical protein
MIRATTEAEKNRKAEIGFASDRSGKERLLDK